MGGQPRPEDAESQAYATRLQRLAGERVLFVGRRDDLPALLNAFDLLVIASERETGPLVLLEALACGLPVLSTPVGRSPELLPAEALFPVGDTAQLAQRLAGWLASEKALATAGAAARRLAEAELGLDRFRAAIRSEVEACLAQPARGGQA